MPKLGRSHYTGRPSVGRPANQDVAAREAPPATPTQEIATIRGDLEQNPGAVIFMDTVRKILSRHEDLAKEGLQGIATFNTIAQAAIKKGISNDAEYKNMVALSTQANDHVKDVANKFDNAQATGFMFHFHRALTRLRNVASNPWEGLRDALAKKAKVWYLEQQSIRREAEAGLQRDVETQKTILLNRAQDLFLSGYPEQARELTAQAELPPPILPEAIPRIDGVSATDKYVGTFTDLLELMKAIVLTETEFHCPHCNARIKPKKPVPLMVRCFKTDGAEKWDRPLVTGDQVVLNVLVSRHQKSLDYPGIEVTPDIHFTKRP